MVPGGGTPRVHAALKRGLALAAATMMMLSMMMMVLPRAPVRSALERLDAAAEAHLEVAKELIEFHANLEAADELRATPLHKAMSAGLEENVQALLKAPGIDVNARDGEGDTALHEVGETFASKSRKHSAVHSISSHGSLCPLFVDALSPR